MRIWFPREELQMPLFHRLTFDTGYFCSRVSVLASSATLHWTCKALFSRLYKFKCFWRISVRNYPFFFLMTKWRMFILKNYSENTEVVRKKIKIFSSFYPPKIDKFAKFAVLSVPFSLHKYRLMNLNNHSQIWFFCNTVL